MVLLVFGLTKSSQAIDESETLALLVRTIQQAEAQDVRESLLRGMLRGLEGRRDVTTPEGWSALKKDLRASRREQTRELATRLSQIFGDEDADRIAIETIRNQDASSDQRRSAFRALVTSRSEELATMLPSLLEDDDLQLDAIRALSIFPNEDAPRQLLARYQSSDDTVRRAIIETLATREFYARLLVKAISEDVVARDKIPAYIARSLRDLLGSEFTKVYGPVTKLNQDVAATIAKYKNRITEQALARADAARGRNVFDKTCGACHKMYDAGGDVGPDLTGSNRANLDYLLLNSVDPSADVPEGYRTVLVQTIDGRVLTGVLAEEDNQRIVLKTVDQPRLVIAKSDIEARKLSEKSMMPEGQLDQLKPQDLFDLIKYMQTTSQVEAIQ
jgi:putative heme-binding domain-containing protein